MRTRVHWAGRDVVYAHAAGLEFFADATGYLLARRFLGGGWRG
jgi:hypothetical protein